jgi:hypothetical protein
MKEESQKRSSIVPSEAKIDTVRFQTGVISFNPKRNKFFNNVNTQSFGL